MLLLQQLSGEVAAAAHGSVREAGRAAARVAAQRPLSAKRPERPKAAKRPCGRRPRGEAAQQPKAANAGGGGGQHSRPANGSAAPTGFCCSSSSKNQRP